LYNLAAVAVAQGWVLVWVGAQELAPFCHNDLQQAVLVCLGQDVLIVQDTIWPQQLLTQRPSYVNSLLIQCARTLVPRGCNQCYLPCPGLWLFLECCILYSHFGDSCGNCKWQDHGIHCVYPLDNNDESDNGSDSRDESSGSSCTLSDGRLLPPPGQLSV
jgi:hypothetical protein